MDKLCFSARPVLFIDSGIGGLPYCIDFHKKNPCETVYYLADTKNFPYGPRKKEELISILVNLLDRILLTINPKIIVLACNTATISAIASLRERFPQIPFVGTVPALKPAAKGSNSGKVGVLGTERTIQEIRNLNLVDETCEIFGLAAPELVEFIEHHFDEADENEKKIIVKKYVDIFRTEGADSLVLGCTHFLFLLEEFRNEAAKSYEAISPNGGSSIEVFDSLAGITKRIEFLLDENNKALRSANDSIPNHQFILTGAKPHVPFWHNRAKALGFKLSFLNDI